MKGPPGENLIIIGAPRSGTNMLRDVLCRLPGLATWPCDEIPYIWRHGNASWPDDAIPASRATPRVRRSIRASFDRIRRTTGCAVLVEKTCANSLRVPFVEKALPEPNYVFIHRDPVDAAASARQRWGAPLDLRYTLAKARFVPWTDVPLYAARFAGNRLHRLVSRTQRVASWGPRISGMQRLLEELPLIDVCAAQWSDCVRLAAGAFAELPAERKHRIRYEEFVQSPAAGLDALCRQFSIPATQADIERAVEGVRPGSVRKGRRSLSDEERKRVVAIAEPALRALDDLARRQAIPG